ncbi:hypothetical protein [Halomarina pelagica]|uniref:hypothetical protein n=1 Tax=Halomarina pelagica TaxID=2961599 RepID=UPI0020C27F46|nr:hypothetical protein [Halomarina sp. BND7]
MLDGRTRSQASSGDQSPPTRFTPIVSSPACSVETTFTFASGIEKRSPASCTTASANARRCSAGPYTVARLGGDGPLAAGKRDADADDPRRAIEVDHTRVSGRVLK